MHHIFLASEFTEAAHKMAHRILPSGKIGHYVFVSVGCVIRGEQPKDIGCQLANAVSEKLQELELQQKPDSEFIWQPAGTRDGKNVDGRILYVRPLPKIHEIPQPQEAIVDTGIFAWERIMAGRGLILTIRLAAKEAAADERCTAMMGVLAARNLEVRMRRTTSNAAYYK